MGNPVRLYDLAGCKQSCSGCPWSRHRLQCGKCSLLSLLHSTPSNFHGSCVIRVFFCLPTTGCPEWNCWFVNHFPHWSGTSQGLRRKKTWTPTALQRCTEELGSAKPWQAGTKGWFPGNNAISWESWKCGFRNSGKIYIIWPIWPIDFHGWLSPKSEWGTWSQNPRKQFQLSQLWNLGTS